MRPICVDHMTLPVGDLERSLAFYRGALVAGMGWVERDIEGLPSFGPEGAEDVTLATGGPLRPTIHLAFAADDFAQVEGFHGAFLLDPDGNNVEAVWHAPTGEGADLAG